MSYSFLIEIQYLSVLLLLAEALYVVFHSKAKQHLFLLIYILAKLVNNTGYLLEMQAVNSQAALFSTKLCYLGKAFIPLALLVIVTEFCRVKMSKLVYGMLAALHTGIFFLVLTCERHTLFYTGWTFCEEGLFPHNVFGHGVVYWLYYSLLMVYVCLGVFLLVRAFFREKQPNRRPALLMLLASILVEILGFVLFLLGVGGGYDITSLSYAVATVFMYLAILRYDILWSMEYQEKAGRWEKSQQTIITGMATMVESRDNSTGAHIKRTSEGVNLFVEYLKKKDIYPNCNEDFYRAVTRAAPMHDLGKIAVDDAILRKPGRFTSEEFETMKRHSEEGAAILNRILKDTEDETFKNIAVNVAHYHHERWDGSGYPSGLKGNEIPFEARIMALADVYDALVSKRCYKESFSFEKARSIIEDSLGSHFDPVLGRHFLMITDALEAMYQRMDQEDASVQLQ